MKVCIIIDIYERKYKIIKRHSGSQNSYFTVSDENTDDVSITNGILTTESVKEIFKEIFEEQQNVLVNIVSQSTTPLQTSLYKLEIDIKDNNDRNVTDDKLKDIENSIEKNKETFKRQIEKLKKDNDDTNNKIRILEDVQGEIIYVLMASKNGTKNLGGCRAKFKRRSTKRDIQKRFSIFMLWRNPKHKNRKSPLFRG